MKLIIKDDSGKDKQIEDIINEITAEKPWVGTRYKLLKAIRRWSLSTITFIFVIKLWIDSEKYDYPYVNQIIGFSLMFFSVWWDWKKTPQSPDLNTEDRKIVEIIVKRLWPTRLYYLSKSPLLKRILMLFKFDKKIMIFLTALSFILWPFILLLNSWGYQNLAYQIADTSLVMFGLINLADATRDSEITVTVASYTRKIFSTINGNLITVLFLLFCNIIAFMIVCFALLLSCIISIHFINHKFPDNILYYGLNYFFYTGIFLGLGMLWRQCSVTNLLCSIIDDRFREKKIEKYYQSLQNSPKN